MHNLTKRLIPLALFLMIPVSALWAQDESEGFDSDDSSEQEIPRQNVDPRVLRSWQRKEKSDQELVNSLLSYKIRRKLYYGFETVGQYTDGASTPLWLNSNRQGLASEQLKAGYLRMSMLGGMQLPTGFLFDYGMDVAVTTGYFKDYVIQQAYVDIGYKWFDISVGMKERWGELRNQNLSSGGLTWSGNSSPIPQVRLEVPEFTRLNFLGGWFSLKGHLAYGWYMDSDWRESKAGLQQSPGNYVGGILHHSKSAFLRVGDVDRFPLEFIWGLEMYAQFGGTQYTLYNDRTVSNSLPSDLAAYWSIMWPFNLAGAQTKNNGNSLGSWHLSFDLTLDRMKARAYYEHFYEDHSSMLGIEYKSDLEGNKDFVFYGFRRNWFDGMYGLEFQLPEQWPVSNIVIEVLNTRGQCGAVYRQSQTETGVLEGVDGRDGYYTHEIYSSYSHFGQNNGNPLLVSPIYNSDGNMRLLSNRALAFHLGIDGYIGQHLGYKLLVSDANHWGTYEKPLQETERITSMMIGLDWWTGGNYGWKLGIQVGADFDQADLLGNNKGVMLSVSKLWKML